jgi:hypothetical protein
MLCLTYVDLAVELKSTYKYIKPHLDFLLFTVCFPVLCLTEEDVDTFENDPHQYVHDQNSFLLEFLDKRNTALQLIENLVFHRKKAVADKLLEYLVNTLNSYGRERASAKTVLAGGRKRSLSLSPSSERASEPKDRGGGEEAGAQV